MTILFWDQRQITNVKPTGVWSQTDDTSRKHLLSCRCEKKPEADRKSVFKPTEEQRFSWFVWKLNPNVYNQLRLEEIRQEGRRGLDASIIWQNVRRSEHHRTISPVSIDGSGRHTSTHTNTQRHTQTHTNTHQSDFMWNWIWWQVQLLSIKSDKTLQPPGSFSHWLHSLRCASV